MQPPEPYLAQCRELGHCPSLHLLRRPLAHPLDFREQLPGRPRRLWGKLPAPCLAAAVRRARSDEGQERRKNRAPKSGIQEYIGFIN